MQRAAKRALWFVLRLFLALALLAFGAATWLVMDARMTPTGDPEYVALGSSFAAGAGLGKREPGSPILCARSTQGYPPQLARKLGLSIVDMSCSGSVTKQVLYGGQFFQEAQIRTLNRQTRLVTVTVGGNDVGFVRDLFLLAERNSDTSIGWVVRKFWRGPASMGDRNYDQLNAELSSLLSAIKLRAPHAKIVVATYPAVLPRAGTCYRLNLTPHDVARMREVEDELARVTRSAAMKQGALVVDMHTIGSGHHACSSSPWTKGWGAISGSPFHPTELGAQATAEAVALSVKTGRKR